MSAAVGTVVREVTQALASRRWRGSTERELQDAIAAVLSDPANFAASTPAFRVVREHRLSDADRVDFALVLEGAAPNVIALEVKVQGSTTAVARQIQRYGQHPDVAALMLVTTAMRLVAALNGAKLGTSVYSMMLRRF